MTIWIPEIDKDSGPIYLAIADAIEAAIQSGELAVGSKLPPQRELAYQLGITLSTVTRAYTEAERRKLVHGETGRGTYVSANTVKSSPLMPVEDGLKTIDLAKNFAHPYLNPRLDEILPAMISEKTDFDLNNYVPSEGLRAHRETGAAFLDRYYRVKADPSQVLISCGAQHGIMVLLQTLFHAGDAVGVDAYTYPALLDLIPQLGLKLVPIMQQVQDGRICAMCPGALEEACKVHHLKGVILIPNVQNPTTHTMTLSEREKIAEVAERYRLLIVEDDPYSPFCNEEFTMFSAYLPELTASVATPSKVMSPGLRTGFIHVPRRYVAVARNKIGSSIWMAPPLTTEITCRWLRDGTVERTLEAKKKATARRFKMVAKVFAGYGLQGGNHKTFCWLHLPPELSAVAIEAELSRQNINVLASNHFHLPGQTLPPALRLSLGNIASDSLFEEALMKVREVIESYQNTGRYGEMMG